MSKMDLPKAYSIYGASMGRTEFRAPVEAPKLRVARVILNGDYDSGGAYWGAGEPLYRIWSNDEDIDMYRRAPTRDAAKALARTAYPNARFYR